jgi:plastocyanin
MRSNRGLGWLGVVLLTAAASCWGANYTVTAGGQAGLVFTPATLTINVGDTVTFVNGGGFHNVVADDSSFTSGPASSAQWSLPVTFTKGGMMRYYCAIHGGPGGSGMAGSITVQSAPAPFDLNRRGLTGSWFQMATAGQGVEVEIYPDLMAPGTGFMQAAWFTYDYNAPGGASSQRWYTFSGNVQSGQPSATLTLYENTGGNFDAPPVTQAMPVGSVVVSADCNHLTMTYTFTDGSGRSGMVPMTRLLPNVTCVASGAETPNADFAYSGNWFDKTTSGQGIVFELNPNQPLAWLTWYTYAPNGQALSEAGQRWYTAQGAYMPGARTLPMTLYETTGGLFDKSEPTPTTVPVGMATATFTSCTALKLDFNFTGGSSAGTSGTINMTRVGPTPTGCGP